VIPVAKEIIGREDELTSIDAFLERTEDGAGALLIFGEPGIGKTTLWERGLEAGARLSARVLSHRSAEAEALMSFTGLSDLLGPVFAEVAPSLVPPRRRALEVVLRLVEPGEAVPDMYAILIRTGTRPTPGQELRVPDSLQELLGGRLARLPTDTGDVLLEVAALARPTVELVVAAHGERQRVLDALDGWPCWRRTAARTRRSRRSCSWG
jgi:AAA ATPase domain